MKTIRKKKKRVVEFKLSVLSNSHYTSYVNQVFSTSLAEGKKKTQGRTISCI